MNQLQEYGEAIDFILDKIEAGQRLHIRSAGDLIAESILDGHIWWLSGTGHHSTALAEEAYFRAGGLMLAHMLWEPWASLPRRGIKGNPIENLPGYATRLLDRSLAEAGDVLMVISNSGRNVLPVEMAIEARKRGLKVISLSSIEYANSVDARHSSGKKLHETVDIALDNCGVLGDTVLEVEGLPVKLGPTSTIAGAAIINAVTICAIERMLDEGFAPPIYMSLNAPGADQWNQEHLERFSDRIHYQWGI
jgi:uncharacterized phosphosugar-binding protein